jgi:UDP-2,3-diacylglucosamine pyrophosphatase LpxH
LKIALLNDTHTGIRNASDIFLDNAEKFYSEVFFPHCKKHNITQIIHLGDYYDNRKTINIKALYRNRKAFLEPMRDAGMHMDIFPGNHDTYYKNTNDVNSLKEVLGHFMNEIHIVMEPTVLEYGGTKFAMLPWLNSQNYEKSLEFIKNCKADILCGHLELEGFELMKGVTNKHGMNRDIFSKFEMVLTGHFHTRSSKDNVTYLGSQMEFFWSDAHDDKYFYVFDTETRELEKIRNPHTLFEKIVYNDAEVDYNDFDVSHLDGKFVKLIIVEKKDTYTFDRFVERIQNQKINELKIAENFSEFLGENVDDHEVSVEDTGELLDSYIEAVDTDLDKDRIKKDMRYLLSQAQSLEIV